MTKQSVHRRRAGRRVAETKAQAALKALAAALSLVALLTCSTSLSAAASTSLLAAAHARDEHVQVKDSILGVRIGATLEETRKKLRKLGKLGSDDARGEREAEVREPRAGRLKEAWALKKTEYATIAYSTDKDGRIRWVTGFVRQGREIPFASLGDLAQTTRKSDTEAVWNVRTPEGGYRLVAKGGGGRARVVYLLSLSVPPIE